MQVSTHAQCKRLREEHQINCGPGPPSKRLQISFGDDPCYGNLELQSPKEIASSDHLCIKDEVNELDAIKSGGQNPTELESICYGSLADAKAEFTEIVTLEYPLKTYNQFFTVPLMQQGNFFYLKPQSSGPIRETAILDLVTVSFLRKIYQHKELTFVAVLSPATIAKIAGKRSKKRQIIDITINIFGPLEVAEAVGEDLLSSGVYLQHPVFLEPFIKYINPQWLYPDDNKTDLRYLISPGPMNEISKNVSNAIEEIFETLGDSHTREEQKLEIEKTAGNFLFQTQLRSHQINGIRFILDRETWDISQNVGYRTRCMVDPVLGSQAIMPCLGGIVADVMGLGKTLTMLSAIACMKDSALEFASEAHTTYDALRPAKSTLVVLPSRQLLDVWDSEIRRHFKPNTLSISHFHGDCRPKTPDALLNHDVVLTTYHTLTADWRNSKVLQGVKWFRIVLDEAHWIRNPATQLYKATQSLSAERRWCLTGTPIQNSLYDLQSLLGFIRLEPFCKAKSFEKYIIDPLRNSSQEDPQLGNLRLLLQSICLRRTDSLLNLPELMTITIPISLSPEEDSLYRGTLSACKAELDRQAGMRKSKNSYNFLFPTIMKLRRLCNHGTMSPAASSHLAPGAAIEESCQICSSSEGESAAALQGATECPSCGRWLDIKSASSPGSLTLTPISPEISTPSSPYSLSHIRSPFAMERGYSSKLRMVATRIYDLYSSQGSQGSVLGRKITSWRLITNIYRATKSLVFTSWRGTLDLLTEMLNKMGIQSLRIDGNINPMGRSAIISKFKEDPSVSTLLMTIDSCAVGLTLTNANTVHIIEPQWNPSVEAQAIARAYRIGQTRTVTVFKYITENTVEQRIVELQRKKDRLAKFSLDSTTKSDHTTTMDDLKFVLD